MKLRKNAILPLLLALICFFAACDEATADETDQPEIGMNLSDFVYDAEIDTDHAITDEELAVMNGIWRTEFGKDLAATPKEAMRREETGDFYFGRYGRIFVFYRKSFEMDMEFGWGKHDFVLPWGEFYFLTDEKVYSRSEIAATNLFPSEYIEAFYDCYLNTYLPYKPQIVPREGEYVLTEADLEWMHGMFEHSPKYTGVDTLGNAMLREKDTAYYFGKFGDTVIVWNIQNYSENPNFTLCGYDFKFHKGAVLFFDPAGLYKPETEGVEGIMTAEEWKAFYDHYIEYYVPLNSDPYACPELSVGIEIPSEDEMRAINEAYGEWKYAQLYNYYYQTYIDAKNTSTEADKYAVRAANRSLGTDPHRFFNEENFRDYQYWGKRGKKFFLATQNSYQALTVLEIAGYKFVLDGSGSEILICEDGKIAPLAEAYEKGIVTKDDAAFAHERHLAYRESLLGGKEETPPPAKLKVSVSSGLLSAEEQREIVWEYIADSNNLESALEATYAVRCFGKFGDACAVMIDGPWMYTDALRNEVVAGYTFLFHNGQRMHIYKEGNFYSLNKAYELGIISENDVTAIAWSKIAPFNYETNTSPIQIDEERAAYMLRSYALEQGSHSKGAIYSMRCYGKSKRGYAVFMDCSDTVYASNKTVETVAGCEFIYPTEQKMVFCYNWGGTSSFEEAIEHEWLTEAELKAFYETYRAAHPQLYE